ncbi:hypothetical protein NicSoilB4_34010 [Arthrobacter sp. NicSoilB4]|uniref:phosphotransferase n=1 Tax=Arthrobacter sp. NicSoilB4 TaxID=2830997 RepID=UPI001CC6E851|nr:phosphotransferase [Arthrobacter sp. NicSoilB4]BCW68638.1 hypothetical protein NicSoilB4_34010 [Arthrobacter sp. NicSoilB4]
MSDPPPKQTTDTDDDAGGAEPRAAASSPATPERRPRIGWADLPDSVRSAVEDMVGSPVIAAHTQPGGYSPGSADRVVTAKGTRFFVKAVTGSLNSESPQLHRREARIMNLLPAGLPIPQLVGTHDDGEWVALVFSDVDGRHPQLSGPDLHAVLDAVDAISARPLQPEALEILPSLTDEVRGIFEGWARLRNDPHPGLDPWAAGHHALLESLSAAAADNVGGDRLAHVDLRADNVLIDGGGRAVIVDWPWAAHGASWFDALTLLVDARVNDPACDTEAALREHLVFTSAAPEQVDSVLAALAGYFLDNARRPSPPGLPTLRAFQQAEGAACLGWLRERLERPEPARVF